VLLLFVHVDLGFGRPEAPDPPEPLSAYLTPDGRLSVDRETAVALDPHGYRLVLAADGAPRFVPAASPKAGDDPWSPQFSVPGTFLGNAIVDVVVVDGTEVFVGGRFDQFDRLVAASVVRWDGSTWSALGGPGDAFSDNGVSDGTETGRVHALAVTADHVYVGGEFTQVNSGATAQGAPGLARWDRSANTWEPLDDLCNVSTYSGGDSCFANDAGALIYALATDGTDLFVGGEFDAADNDGTRIRVSNLAAWSLSTQTWRPLLGTGDPDSNADNGTDQPVYALLLDGTDLFVGGEFFETYRPGSPDRGITFACSVVRFDLSAQTWNPLGGPGANNPDNAECDNGTRGKFGDVYALAGDAGRLYVGGDFAVMHEGATRIDADNVAAWTGSAWEVLGDATGNGVDAPVNALLLDGTDLYLAGRFDRAFDGSATVRPQNVARWDGSAWRTLGGTSSLENGLSSTARGLARDADGRIWAVGAREACTSQGCRLVYGAGRWDGSTWLGPPTGTSHAGITNLNVPINAVVVDGSDVYVAGGINRLITPSGETLYPGGVAKWTGSTWELFGGPGTSSGLPDNGIVGGVANAIVVDGTDVYIGGAFDEVTSNGTTIEANNVAKWDGSQWVSLGGQGSNARNNGVSAAVHALTFYDGALHVGGEFRRAYTNTSEVDATRIVRWTGAAWQTLGGPGATSDDNGIGPSFSSSTSRVLAFEVVGSDLYVGGEFEQANTSPSTLAARNLVRWNGSSWNAVGGPGDAASDNGLDRRVRAIAFDGGDLFVGGDFEAASNPDGSTIIVQNIARWDGAAWDPLAGPGNSFTDNGIDGSVRALALNAGFVFAAGEFLATFGSGSGVPHRHVTAYNRGTDTWEQVGSGTTFGNVIGDTQGAAYALDLGNGQLHVGGDFLRAGGRPAYGFGQYDVVEGNLPVELASIDARVEGEAVRLSWRTAAEVNNAGFFVERAGGDGGFTALGFVDGRGTTDTPQDYRFTDARPPFAADSLTYRLRQVDLDGTETLSPETVVRLGAPARLTLQAPFPNPVRGAATLRWALPEAAEGTVAVYNVLGQRMATLATGRLPAGRAERRLDTRQWASGLYFVRLVADGAVQTRRLMVVR
jgi:hypothetical protein